MSKELQHRAAVLLEGPSAMADERESKGKQP